jgi:hypothetical protein
VSAIFDLIFALAFVCFFSLTGLLRLVCFIVGVAMFLKAEFFVGGLLIYAAIWPETLHD